MANITDSPEEKINYFPIFLDLTGKKCVVVGGGSVAERKCESLIKAGADVTVIAPMITKGLKEIQAKGQITYVKRDYQAGDLEPAFLVIAATDYEEINQKVAEDAKTSNKLVNVVDEPALCSYITPAVFQRGHLTIAISTGGASPAIAKEIREELQKLYGGPEFKKRLENVKNARDKVMKEIKDRTQRSKAIKEIVSTMRGGSRRNIRSKSE